MRPDSFQINQAHLLLQGVSKQIKLPLAAEVKDQQVRQITFFPVTNIRIFCNPANSGIYICCPIVMQLFVLSGKAPGLANLAAHSARLRATKGMASSRDSAIEANDSAIKITGRSGLPSAARPTFAQYSTWPEIV